MNDDETTKSLSDKVLDRAFSINFPRPIELKSSLFLRPYSPKLALLEKVKQKRVKNAMTQAAKKGENFHLWGHPHNFGVNQAENLANLEAILKHCRELNREYGMLSLTMQELGAYV